MKLFLKNIFLRACYYLIHIIYLFFYNCMLFPYFESLHNEISTIVSSRRLGHVTTLYSLSDLPSTAKIKHRSNLSSLRDSRRQRALTHWTSSASLPAKSKNPPNLFVSWSPVPPSPWSSLSIIHGRGDQNSERRL